MLTYEQALPQAPQIWDKPTPLAQIGDIIRIPFVPVMLVVDRDILKDGRVWLLVRPTTGSTMEEWVVEPLQVEERELQLLPKPQEEPVGRAYDRVRSSQQLLQKPQGEPVGKAADTVRLRLQKKLEDLEEFEIGRRYGRGKKLHKSSGTLLRVSGARHELSDWFEGAA